jgi:hypothetical protein
MPSYLKGERIYIHSGTYKHKKAWLNIAKKPGAVKVSIVYEAAGIAAGVDNCEVAQIE